jgi:microcystin-dependent protein
VTQPFIGEIKMFAGNFAPRGYAFCNGQLLSIAQNTALFSILGTTYGGNGQTTFGLPNMQSRVPIHWGQGPGLSPYSLGELAGDESVTLLSTQMHAHSHVVNASNAATSKNPSGNVPGFTAAGSSYNPTANVAMNPAMVANAGGSQPHTNIQPFLCVSFIIAMEGIFPSRN